MEVISKCYLNENCKFLPALFSVFLTFFDKKIVKLYSSRLSHIFHDNIDVALSKLQSKNWYT